MQRIANPCTPVRFRPRPPLQGKPRRSLIYGAFSLLAGHAGDLAGPAWAVYSPALASQRYRPNGEIGRRRRLKISRQQWRAGSSPASGTIFHAAFGDQLGRGRLPQFLIFPATPTEAAQFVAVASRCALNSAAPGGRKKKPGAKAGLDGVWSITLILCAARCEKSVKTFTACRHSWSLFNCNPGQARRLQVEWCLSRRCATADVTAQWP